MSTQNKILTTLNQPLSARVYTLPDRQGDPTVYSTLSGLPLGTSDNSQDGEIGLKVIVIEQRGEAADAELAALQQMGLAQGGQAVTPHDSNDNIFDGLYIGTTGDVAVEHRDTTEATYVAVPAGTFMPIAVNKVKDTGTDATDIVGLIS